MKLFPRCKIHHLTSSLSDHCPLLISSTSESSFQGVPRFKFEVWWTMEESIEEEVKKSWEPTNGTIVEKLKGLQFSLEKWAALIKKNRDGLKRKVTKEFGELIGKDRDDEILTRAIDARIHLNMEIDKDEMFWEQRARANWLQLGDKNTTFFHNFAFFRIRINTINRLETAEGKENSDKTEINEAATAYFQNLLSHKGVGNLTHLLSGINKSISQDMNAALLAEYSVEEVYSALKDTGPTKTPGHDGFLALFFQKFWHIVGRDVEDFFLGVLNEGKDFDSLNLTELVLIPRISNPTNLVNFRPISLYTVVYKLVTKTIANRLQKFIGRCIDYAKSAFVPS